VRDPGTLSDSRCTVAAMATEVWFRNPHDYVREVVEAGCAHIVFDWGVMVKKGIDDLPKFCNTYFPSVLQYRAIGVAWAGAPEYRRGDTLMSPSAVYPVWDYENDDRASLEEMIERPAGEDEAACSSTALETMYRPVLGQEHRIVLTNLPPSNTGPGRSLMRMLRDLQAEHPDVIFHIHGLYSYRLMFGAGFRAADVDPRTPAQKGKVVLPSGKEMAHEHTSALPMWTKLMGFAPVDLGVPRNRCIFNIKSAQWAGEHWHEDIDFKLAPGNIVEVSTVSTTRGRETAITKGTPINPGDMVACDSCSLTASCKAYREGAACSVKGSEMSALARMFKTRDSDTIIDGLQAILAKQAERAERGVEDEQLSGELDPEVTKILNSLFGNGVKLAKLVNPSLNGGPKVGVFVNGGQVGVTEGASPKQMVAGIVRELEQQGIPRSQITPEMIQNVIGGGRVQSPVVIAGELT